jgi:outer membrane protein assembly factor BamB
LNTSGIISGTPTTTGTYNFTVQVKDSSTPQQTASKALSISISGGATPGTIKWRFETANSICSSPAIGADGTIYIGSLDGNLYALNSDGTEKWRFATGDDIWASPAVASDGTIYICSDTGKLYALTPTGQLEWEFTPSSLSSRSCPAIGDDGTIYLSADGLYAINPNGTLKWRLAKVGVWDFLAPIGESVIGADGTIYTGCYTDQADAPPKLYAVSPGGVIIWSVPVVSIGASSPAIGADGTIYVNCSGVLCAISPIDGTIIWSYTINGGDSSPVIGMDGTIYIGSSEDDKLYAINPDGTKKWDLVVGAVYKQSPSIGADGTVFFGGGPYLFALNPDKSIKWRTLIQFFISSCPAIDSHGTLYVCCNNSGEIVAVNGSTTLANTAWPMYRHDQNHTGRK